MIGCQIIFGPDADTSLRTYVARQGLKGLVVDFYDRNGSIIGSGEVYFVGDETIHFHPWSIGLGDVDYDVKCSLAWWTLGQIFIL